MASLSQVTIDLQLKGQREVLQGLKAVARTNETLSRGLKVTVDSSNKNAKSLDRISREAVKVQREMDRLNKAVQQGTVSQSAFHGETTKLANRLRSLGMANARSEVMRYYRALNEARSGTTMLSTATVRATATSDAFENQVRQTTAAVSAQNSANHFAGRRMNAMGMATQQAGYQAGDFLVQVQSGTNAFVAFGQQATQLVGILPLMADSLGVSTGKLIAISSILGILIPLATAFGAALSRTGGGGEIFEELAFAIEPIRPLLDAIAVAMSTVADITIDFVNILVNNLDRIVVTATVVAGFFAAKWVAAFVAARIATFSLSAALVTLRAALIRTGIGAIIVAAGELAYQFTKLVSRAGGFGNAMSLLSDVAVEAWGRVKTAAIVVGATFAATFNEIKADAASAVQSSIESMVGLANTIANSFEGAFLAVQAIWNALPTVFSRVGALAMNALVEAMQEGLSGIVGVLNDVLTIGGRLPDMAIPEPDLSGWRATVPEAANIGSAISDAFSSAFEDSPLSTPDLGLQAIIDRSLADADFYRSVATDLANTLNLPLQSLDALRAAMLAADEEGRSIDVRDWFSGLGADTGEDSGGATAAANNALTELQERVQSIADTIKSSMSDAFMSIVDGTKSAKEAFKDMARNIIKQLYDVLVIQRLVGSFNATTGVGSGLVGMIMGAFQADGGVWRGGSQVQAFANGGVVGGPMTFPMSNGMTGLMGEAGPEAIMPLKRGKDGKLGVQAEGGGGSVVVNQTINVSTGVQQTVRAEIKQLMPQIAESAKSAVVDAKRRGGSYGRAFA